MYISYIDFNVLFKKIDLNESDFTIFEGYAAALVNGYVGKVLTDTGKDIGQATGLIIQSLIATGQRPQDLPASYSEGGISTNYTEIELIPPEARKILDKYRDVKL